ncbi:hypothetical protein [Ohtaekwangia sp.]|uniref:hypothetical protein n=1 Tax=Ohtaekwangia sp. TaxID=2066019 RepID=UPI002F952689
MITRIYTGDYVVIDYDLSVPCTMATYFDFMLPAEFKAHMNFALEIMQEKIRETGRMLWMPDVRLAPARDQETIHWIMEDWNLRAIKAGIRHIAMIVPEELWVVMAIEDYSSKVQADGMTVKYFKDVASAKNWFIELPYA